MDAGLLWARQWSSAQLRARPARRGALLLLTGRLSTTDDGRAATRGEEAGLAGPAAATKEQARTIHQEHGIGSPRKSPNPPERVSNVEIRPLWILDTSCHPYVTRTFRPAAHRR